MLPVTPGPSLYARGAKRALDLLLVLGTLPLWLPLTLAVGVVVRLRLGAPVTFCQLRPGRGARPFRMIKFRSMTDARDTRGRLLPDADRLPAFGQRLRASSLDELPSLWNVLRGDMSLVGPRPLLMAYLDLYTQEQARRHEVRPGLTGWAQIHGRNRLSWEDRFALDVWYVDHVSLQLDLRILAGTLRSVVRRDGITADGHATTPEFKGTPGRGGPAGHGDSP